MIKSIQLVAFEDRAQEFVFVRVPNERGRYVRTLHCVIEVECPHCKSMVGEPCKGAQGYWAGTHYDRRRKATLLRRFKKPNPSTAYDVVEQPRDWLYVATLP